MIPRLALCSGLLYGGLLLFAAAHGGVRRGGVPPSSADVVEARFHFLLDRSGSMSGLEPDVIGGFNSYLKTQRDAASAADDVRISLIQFDTPEPHGVCVDDAPISDVAPLTAADYQPRGGTPLYDAIGLAIARASEHAAEMGETGRTVVIIFTDGAENSSKEHTKASVARLIAAKEAEGWAFVFMGANQDAFGEAGAIGVGRGSTQNFVADGEGMRNSFKSLGGAMSNYLHRVRSAKQSYSAAMSAPVGSAVHSAGASAFESELATAASTMFVGFDDAQRDFDSRQRPAGVTQTAGTVQPSGSAAPPPPGPSSRRNRG